MAQQAHFEVTDTPADYPIYDGHLEIRQGPGSNPVLTASFPLNKTATISSTGRVRKERFNSGSMSWQVREFQKLQTEMSQVLARGIDDFMGKRRFDELDDALNKRNSHLLIGHDFNRPIADMRSGNLHIEHTPDAVHLRADLPLVEDQPSWVVDAVKSVRGGQMNSVSPGFNMGKGSSRLVPEEGNPGVMIREIQDSVVYEYSLVSRPSYPGTTVDTRSDRSDDGLVVPKRRRYWF